MSKKRYSVNYEDDEVVSVSVNGVEYASVEDIPDPDDRAAVELLPGGELDMDKARAEAEASGAGLTRVLLGLFSAIAVLALAVAIYAGGRTWQAPVREWTLTIIFGVLGLSFALASFFIWKVFGVGAGAGSGQARR
jgi:hypothetical protein